MKKMFEQDFWVTGYVQSFTYRIAAFVNLNNIKKEDIVYILYDPTDRDKVCLLYYADINFIPKHIRYSTTGE
jgi:hypothetical protein